MRERDAGLAVVLGFLGMFLWRAGALRAAVVGTLRHQPAGAYTLTIVVAPLHLAGC